MQGTMSRADLVADLQASLQDAASLFTAADSADYIRHLDMAALDLGRHRHRTLLGTLTVIAEQYQYAAPADLLVPKSAIWGRTHQMRYRPWDRRFPGTLPRIELVETPDGNKLHLIPAPTADQITQLGGQFDFYYFAGHSIADDAAQTTIASYDRGLLILRAQAEAMAELAMRGVGKAIKPMMGGSGTPRNGTPAALAQQFMDTFYWQVKLP